jgi:hypothetical protein
MTGGGHEVAEALGGVHQERGEEARKAKKVKMTKTEKSWIRKQVDAS